MYKTCLNNLSCSDSLIQYLLILQDSEIKTAKLTRRAKNTDIFYKIYNFFIMRLALLLEYKGTNYHGWQKQDGLVTVQEAVEQALSKVAAQPIQVVCAGRTDAGVHAAGQVIHFDTKVERSMRAWVFGGNSYLPQDIRLQLVKPVEETFHARFSALARSYRYLIYNHEVPSALLHKRATFYPHFLNVDLMQEAAQYLLGEHDFSAFRGSSCQAHNPLRNVMQLQVRREGQMVIIDITANAFLQHMVRNIAGVLLEIGVGKRLPLWAQDVLVAQNRTLAGVTASAQGLYLMHVQYADVF